MFKNLKQTIAAMMVLFGFSAEADIPISAENKALDLTADQIAKLEAHFGKDYAKKMVEGVNAEIKAHMESNMDIKAIQDEIDAIVKEKALVQEELNKDQNAGANSGDISHKLELLNKAHSDEKKKREELEATVQKLMDEGVGDKPDAIIKPNHGMKVLHSNTHLFADNKEWNKFEKRGWNARLRDNSIKATDFNQDGNIPLLQDDIAHFVRENPNALESLFNDFAELPMEWDRRTGVLDRVADGFIIPSEVVQGRSKGWKPKGDFKISAEEGRVFRKKIDITFNGYELQEIENTWIRRYNGSDGSHPWKMTFVYFLLSELVKQQKLDDRKAQINGIYVETPEGDGNPGAAINSQDGLRFLFWYYRDIAKKYRAADIGLPTATNIVDYVRTLILSLPEEDRSKDGLELGLSQAWLDAYRLRAGTAYQVHMSTDEGRLEYNKNYPIDYPNIKFQPLKDMVKTDFMYITLSKNIQILDYNVNEKGKFTVIHDKRDTHIFADYRLGIRIKQVGVKQAAGEPANYERQMVWSNNVPVFDANTSVPVFDDRTGIVKLHYNTLKVDKDWVTDITQIDGAVKGTVVKIIGNTSLVANKFVKDQGDLDLTADFNLKSGGTLTLYVKPDMKLKEISRTSAPEVVNENASNFDVAILDANLGTEFKYVGVADVTLTNILNGVDGKVIKVFGTDAVDIEVTVADVAGKINVESNVVLADSNDYVELMRIDGVWQEINRSITV